MNRHARLARMLALAWIAIALLVPAGADAQVRPLAFGACQPTQVIVPTVGLQCATLQVPFDRANPAAATIALAVQRIPASGPREGVIVMLAGGPGQPALPVFEEFLAPLAREPALRGFELVAFDQRGTGQSQSLQCINFPQPKETASAFDGTCGTDLGVTRPFYTSQESVEDLDALRQALGGTPLSLFAVSYGTRVAGMYAREHPQGVARMVLDSAVPTTGPQPLDLSQLHALRRVLDEGVCGAGACRSFASDVYADLKRVVAALHRHQLHTKIYNAHGRLAPAVVTEAGLLSLLMGLDLAPAVRELAPAAIAAATHGNAAPLARLTHALQPEPGRDEFASRPDAVLPGSAAAPELEPLGWNDDSVAAEAPLRDVVTSGALYEATFCDENELPWSPQSPPAARPAILRSWLAALPAGDTAPFAPATALAYSPIFECEAWPATPPAPPAPTGISATPTLILSGDDDLRTPYEQDLTIAAGYSDAQLLRVPDVGHSTVTDDRTGCARTAMIEFLASGHAPTSCAASSEPQALPLPPASLADVPAAQSASRAAGRVAAAAVITLEDLFGQTSFGGGGLRGGSWEPAAHGYKLKRMVDVPGVALSGRVSVTVSPNGGQVQLGGHLTIGGRLAGRLTLHGRTLSGRVGGVFARAQLAAL